ncbi:MAG: ABC transporter permease subunit [Halobacteriales archaeon]|nr:ABC transporter permease subunit [Halobacteriales archaeon]
MTWLVVARKEFADAVRARVLWGIVAVIGVLAGGLAVVTRFLPGIEPNSLTALGAASEFAAILVPILSLVAAYLAVAGERESGSVKVLLGLPPSRGEVLLGKFVGRSGVVAVGLALGFAVAGAATAAAYGGLPLTKFVGLTALTVALGVAFVGIAVGISAATATRSRAMSLSIAVYLVFVLLWDLLPQGALPPSQRLPARRRRAGVVPRAREPQPARRLQRRGGRRPDGGHRSARDGDSARRTATDLSRAVVPARRAGSVGGRAAGPGLPSVRAGGPLSRPLSRPRPRPARAPRAAGRGRRPSPARWPW